MRARATLLALPLIVGVAFAQSSAGTTPPAGAAGAPAEMKTMTYRGTLVDLGCGSTAAATAKPDANAAASANRSAEGGGCAVSANSTKLGLKTDSGQVMRFDMVGNQRAIDALKTNKGWGKSLAANKPLKVKVHGAMQGDKLIVSSID